METLSDKSLPLALPPYTQLITRYTADDRALWIYLNPKPRPCFTPTLLTEMRDLQERVSNLLQTTNEPGLLRYYVYASAVPGVFNLGGDIELFARLIAARDREALTEYGRVCIDVVHANATSLDIPTLTTIALVQGSAFGGGLECALSCNTVIAEESARVGFPEILFNLFPGMGALSFLARRIELARAERLVSSGELYPALKFWEMGAIDEIAPDGEGLHTALDFIRRHSRAANGRIAIRQASRRVSPLTRAELLDIVQLWVEAALNLTPRDLRMMNRLVTAQSRLDAAPINPTSAQSRHERLVSIAGAS